jgi:hypothetical protein
MCIYENKLLQCAIELIKSRGHAIRYLTFDGNNYYHDNFKELLQFIAAKISRNFEDLNIELDYKKHDDTIKLPDNFDEGDIEKVIKKNKLKNEVKMI